MVTKEVETTVETIEKQEVTFCDRCGAETKEPEELHNYSQENFENLLKQKIAERFHTITHHTQSVATPGLEPHQSPSMIMPTKKKDGGLTYPEIDRKVTRILDRTSLKKDPQYHLCDNCIREFDDTRDVISLPPEETDEKPPITNAGIMWWIASFVLCGFISSALTLGFYIPALLGLIAFGLSTVFAMEESPALHA